MTTPRDVAAAVAAALGSVPRDAAPVGGGDINDALRLSLADGRTVFVKHHADPPAPHGRAARAVVGMEVPPPGNPGREDSPSAGTRTASDRGGSGSATPSQAAGMFAAEARGLAWLDEPHAIRIPQVLAVDEHWLALEWLDPGERRRDFAAALGRGLAALHASGAPSYGLDHDNFIAILPQSNTPAASMAEFYVERRLRPMVDRAAARGRARTTWHARLDRLRARWADVAGPDEPPARLHGDLWSGNVHAAGGAPALIDPAVYGGHREIDLAMLALFGGLSAATADAYHEAFPLADGWRDRASLWQLYPLLVHTVLFGGGYGAQVDAALAALT